jgi:hypothetical protein
VILWYVKIFIKIMKLLKTVISEKEIAVFLFINFNYYEKFTNSKK